MSFRTVIIESHSKLEYSLGYLVFRTSKETKRILLNEINTIVVQTTQCSITSSLLSEIIRNKINLIFCDEKQNPISQLLALSGSYNGFKKIKLQMNRSSVTKSNIWKEIVKEKIKSESVLLKKYNFDVEYNLLREYYSNVESNDITNREGHSAKVYFNKIFYNGFNRNSVDKINIYLNYGYTLILSAFNRCITSLGYLTQIGIHHIGETNPFNLSCDFMEPFRVFVDQMALKISDTDDFKDKMISLLSSNILIGGKNQTIINAISIYTQSVITSLNEDVIKIVFPDSYEF